jgi:hypothetical protein
MLDIHDTRRCPHGKLFDDHCEPCEKEQQAEAEGWCLICGGKDGEHKSGCQDGSEVL